MQSDDISRLFHGELKDFANRLSDQQLRHLKFRNVAQFAETKPGSMEGKINYRHGADNPQYHYIPLNADWYGKPNRPRNACSIAFMHLRTQDPTEVSVQAIDTMPSGKKSMSIGEWTNPSPVPINETAETTKEVQEHESKRTTISSSFSAEYTYKAEAKAGIKIAEASVSTTLSTKLEAAASHEVSNELLSQLKEVNKREFTVPGWSWFKLSLIWEQSKATQRVRFVGDLDMSVEIWGDNMMDETFDNLFELRECLRGLRGDKYHQFSQYYEANPLDDDTVSSLLSFRPVVIDVNREVDLADNMTVATQYGKLSQNGGPTNDASESNPKLAPE